jgi:hypothetical protein
VSGFNVNDVGLIVPAVVDNPTDTLVADVLSAKIVPFKDV